MATAWVVRSGKRGEREAWSLANGYAGTGWHEVGDLTPYETRDAIAAAAPGWLRDAKEGALPGYVGQLWALRGRIQKGDLMVLPLKTTREIALGRVSGGYRYLADEPDPQLRHVIPVEWIRTDVPRSAVKQDLLFILGSALTIFAPSKHHAVARLEHLLADGTDPGQIPSLQGASSSSNRNTGGDMDALVDEPEIVPDPEDQAQTQIRAKIAEEFASHDLADLVASLLEIDGFVCRKSPPGADGGVDIMAGRGLLGIDSPLLLVQVKSGAKVGGPVMQQLHGAMGQYGADQGLLVSWGGLTSSGQSQMQNAHMRVALWTAEDVIDAVLANYDRLPSEIRDRLPLKRVWMLAE